MTTNHAAILTRPVERTAVASKPKATDFGRILATAIAWSSIISFLSGMPTWWLTGNLLDGIAMGLFIAFWAGPGFGTMIAVSLWSSRNNIYAPPARNPLDPTPTHGERVEK